MEIGIIGAVLVLLVGVCAGVAGKYLLDRRARRRRLRADERQVRAVFNQVRSLMPELIKEMRADLAKNPAQRAFLILPTKDARVPEGGSHLVYFEDRHANLSGKIAILKDRGYVFDITQGSTFFRYQMTDAFAALLME